MFDEACVLFKETSMDKNIQPYGRYCEANATENRLLWLCGILLILIFIVYGRC